MRSASPKVRDLVTVLYRPRETMRRVLDGGTERWTSGLLVLTFLCVSVSNPDIRLTPRALTTFPELKLLPTLAFVALVLIVVAICWVACVYVGAAVVTLAGRLLGGVAPVADVRAAIAWGGVPLIWSLVYRIPLGYYQSRITIEAGNSIGASIDFIRQGGCGLAVALTALRIAFDLWTAFVVSATVAEALRFETWKGLATLAITAAAPIVVGIAAALAFH